MTFSILLLNCADLSLGKIDKSSLSQQTLMEIFINIIENNYHICISEGDEISKWNDVTVNDSNEIIEIDWWDYDLEGSIQLEWLPSSLQEISFRQNYLTGSLDLEKLPEQTHVFAADHNEFDGSICLEKLPHALYWLDLMMNRLTGTVCLTSLPPRMEILEIGKNRFLGTIDLTRLPDSLKRMGLFDNGFEGWTDFSRLPDGMDLEVSDTNLEGEIRVPKGLTIKSKNTKVVVIE